MPDLKLELNPALVRCLSCPVCGAAMDVSEDGKSLLCRGGGRPHLFDGGAGGYVPLSRHGGGGDSKEAVAFAVLGYETMNRRPGNLPAATGASGPVILGSITY